MKHPSHYDTDEETSKRMRNIKLKHGKAESILAKELWHLGYRYRLNYKGLPGTPDIAILKYRIAVFVDGEFWHGKDWTERKNDLHRNREYWVEKIEENIKRDKRVNDQLQSMDWIVLRFWSKDVLLKTEYCIKSIECAKRLIV